jgi:hypothetical protein
MDATPNNPDSFGSVNASLPGGRSHFGQVATASAIASKWSALHDAAAAVCAIAGLPGEPMRPELRQFPALIRNAAGWRREMAEQGVEDLAALMEPGLSALLAASARGVSPISAAQALWREFVAARDAVLELAPPAGH